MIASSPSQHYPRLEARNSKNHKNGGLTRANAYIAGIFTYQYDLEEMLIAYGVKEVTETLISLHENMKQGKRYKDRHKVAKKVRALVTI